MFRVGVWPNFYPGVQFSKEPEALNQYFRQMTPDTGSIDIHVNSDAVTTLFDRIGGGILVTHSYSGGMGWDAVLKSSKIRAVPLTSRAATSSFRKGRSPTRSRASSAISGPLACRLPTS